MSEVEAPEEITAATPDPVPAKRKFRIRAFCAGLCLVLGAILLPVGIIGFWGKNTVTNPETFSTVVNETVSDPIVQDEVATWATDQIVGYVQESNVLDNAPQLKALFSKFGFSLKPLVYPFVLNLVQSTSGRQVLATIITRAQTAILDVLEGNPPPGTVVRNGEVVVDFNSLTDAIKAALEKRGIELPKQLTNSDSFELPKDLADKIPDNVRDRINGATDGAVDRANESLNSASDRLNDAQEGVQQKASDFENRLNADPIVLMNESQLKQAQAIYALTVPIATWLIVFAIALFAGAIALSTRRLRMTLISGVLWILGGIAVFLVISIGQNQFTNAFEGTLFQKGSNVFYELLIGNLSKGAWLAVIVGIIMVLVPIFVRYRNSGPFAKPGRKPVAAPGEIVQEEVEMTDTVVVASDGSEAEVTTEQVTETATDERPTTP